MSKSKPVCRKTKTVGRGSTSTSTLFTKEEKGPYAVVVADLLAPRFDPLAKSTPPCLLPLANVPLIQFTLARLIEDGFKEILVYSCRLSGLVSSFISSNYHQAVPGVRITVRNGEGSHSLGDVMRDLDSCQILHGVVDFLLVPADLICATSLRPFFEAQQARRNRIPSAILSLLLPPKVHLLDNRGQAAEWGVTVVYSRTAENRLIKLLPISQMHHFNINLIDLIRSDQLIELSSELMDVGIAVCSSHVPPLFQDNFDYQSMHDLIHDVLTNEEVIGYSIHVDRLPQVPMVLPAAPDLICLIDLTAQILSRQANTNKLFLSSKLLFNSVVMDSEDCLRAVGPSVYVAQSASIAPSVQLIGACLIGPGCRIEQGSCLIDCVLAADSRVGPNCRLRRAIVGQSVEIGDGVVVDTAWICEQARLLSGIHLPQYCFVGPPNSYSVPVTIGPGKGQLPSKCILVSPEQGDLVLEPKIGGDSVMAALYKRTHKKQRHASSPTQSSGPSDEIANLSDSSGTESSEDEFDRDIQAVAVDLWTTAEDRIRLSSKHYRQHRRADDARSSDQSRLLSVPPHSRRSGRQSRTSYGSSCRAGRHRESFVSKTAGSSDVDDLGEDDDEGDGERSEAFLIAELRHTLEHQSSLVDSNDNILLEINSLKHAYNIPIDDLYFFLVKSLLDLTITESSKGTDDTRPDVKQFISVLKLQFTRLKPVFSSYRSSCPTAGRLCLQAVEDTACYRPIVMQASPYLLHLLYDQDLILEGDIWWWVDSSPLLSDEDLAEGTRRLRKNIASFLRWLKEAEESSGDD